MPFTASYVLYKTTRSMLVFFFTLLHAWGAKERELLILFVLALAAWEGADRNFHLHDRMQLFLRLAVATASHGDE